MAHETGRIPDLAELADRLAIMDVLAQHSRGVDRADEAVLKSAYWPDADVDYGAYKGPAHAFCAMLPKAIRGWAATHHLIGNLNIRIEGDDARVETYVSANHFHRIDGSPDNEMMYFGRYLDRMQRRGAVWKIMHRRVVMDWNQFVDATPAVQGPPIEGLTRGTRHPEDPLYAHLRFDG